MVKLYLVRHCEAEGNAARLFHGHYDSSITENGRRQLEKLARRFSGIKLDRIYSSPLKRAHATASAISEGRGIDIKLHPGLMEINGGDIEGISWRDFPLQYPDLAEQWNDNPHLVVMPGGESMAQLQNRIWSTVLDIVGENPPGSTILAASHGCAIRSALCCAMNIPIENLGQIPWGENTNVNLLEFSEDLSCNVIFKNDSAHLDDDLLTLGKQRWFKEGTLFE